MEQCSFLVCNKHNGIGGTNEAAFKSWSSWVLFCLPRICNLLCRQEEGISYLVHWWLIVERICFFECNKYYSPRGALVCLLLDVVLVSGYAEWLFSHISPPNRNTFYLPVTWQTQHSAHRLMDATNQKRKNSILSAIFFSLPSTNEHASEQLC